jgi:hypothetical protein
MRWAGHVAGMGERRGVYGVLMEKPDEKKLLGRRRHKMEHNSNIDLQEIGWGAWTELMWLRIGTDDGNL